MGGGYSFRDKKNITDNDTDIKAIHPPDSKRSKLSISYVVIGFHLLSIGSANKRLCILRKWTEI